MCALTLVFIVSPYDPLNPKKLNEAADRALDHYLNPSDLKAPVIRKVSTMFIVAPDIDNESLLAHACESLALAIQQVIMLAELAVNRALDNVDVPQAV
ncbi:hypothetical protein HP062_24065 [Pseudomonas sp. B14-6]|uniref:hypothetical protein n=1 Tax=Pseudomonas sp. B14-6 TaxID=2738843 RepID=UPI00155DFA2A|nr:hypothetical protein [Pseudomonas sp. B14-6]QKG68441.1 hypothetical protein HP062_24065 [Pseudomonas sp. B14-6]